MFANVRLVIWYGKPMVIEEQVAVKDTTYVHNADWDIY